MKKKSFLVALVVMAVTTLVGCPGAGPLDDLTESEATAIIMFVYSQLNSYAISGPGDYGSVTVEDDYHADVMNAKYTNNVTVQFDQHASGDNTVDGAGLVEAYMDSDNGRTGAAYSGTFTGVFNGLSYRLGMDYESWNDAGTGIGSEGTFTVNRRRYEVTADGDMIYDYFGM